MEQRTEHGKRAGSRSGPNRPSAERTAERQRTPRGSAAPETHGRGLIVGIGASAGGLEAFKTFFAAMPPDSGLAFVLVQHLDPHHKSLLVDLIGRATEMTVTEAEDGVAVAANRIFVIPPDATLTIENGVLRVAKPAPAREHRRPIDTFFCALAEDQGENAVCVILSGTGTDGTRGLMAVKEQGGLTLAQAVADETAMSGMPNSAAATGLVDHLLPVEAMAAKLVEYRRHLIKIDDRKDPDGTRRDTADHLAEICRLLRGGLGHDFSQYKEKTLVRRVQRRMQVLQIDTVPDYVDTLKRDPRELELLFRDLLIGVTQFFRDPEAFEALAATVLSKLLETARGGAGDIRVWVPACATGEEAYSIAILLREAMVRLDVAPKVQIFATDLDEKAVAVARAGLYRKTMSGLSPERLERWFAQDGDHYRPVTEIREMCVFSAHSVIKDPPFSRLDLISCRNLMIYLAADLQTRLVLTFHYALRPGGHLFLGPSETVVRHAEHFAVVDKKHRIFQRRDDTAASLPRLPFSDAAAGGQPGARAAVPAKDGVDKGARRVMEKYAPAYLVVDRQHRILRFAGETGPYLEPSPGAASLDLLDMLRRDLRPAAHAAARQALDQRQRVVHESLAVEAGGQSRLINLIVEPIPGAGSTDHYVVAFQDLGTAGQATKPTAPDRTTDDFGVEGLQKELRATEARLQAAIDEQETANEELKSANEEYQSVNEELQSSNEELETSKEEQQSINEELQTVNAELNGKTEALIRANSDLQNLLESTQIATLFLNNDLRVKSFTPPMTDLFHLRDSDRGRPITEIVTRLSYADLKRDVGRVLRSLSIIEREVQVDDGASFLMRIRPYRRVDNVIDGIVATFVDISAHKRHEAESAHLAAIVDSSQDAIIGHSFDGAITSWNAGAERIFGYEAAEVIGKPIAILLPEHQADQVPRILDTLRQGNRVEPFQVELTRKGGGRIDASLTISPIRDAKGTMIAASTIARDVSERRQSDEHRNLLIGELDHRVKNMLAIVSSMAAQTLRTAESSDAFVETFQGRLKALSRVQRLLTESSWRRVALADILREELLPFRVPETDNIVIKGREGVALTPKATQALAMAFHELATNAVKHGALSVAEGRIEVAWHIANGEADPRVTLDWIETGGPPMAPPSRRGFGFQLIERGLAYELDGTVQREFPAEGMRCRIAFDLTDKIGELRADDRGEG